MTINLAAFTPFSSFVGGVMIGLGAAVLIVLNGRIAGISGIFGGLLHSRSGDTRWRLAFLAGLVSAPVIWQLVTALPPVQIESSYFTLMAAGLIVGISTRYGAGCTSGHGVCGLARRSRRSLMATMIFMASGFATVFAVRHLLGG